MIITQNVKKLKVFFSMGDRTRRDFWSKIHVCVPLHRFHSKKKKIDLFLTVKILYATASSRQNSENRIFISK